MFRCLYCSVARGGRRELGRCGAAASAVSNASLLCLLRTRIALLCICVGLALRKPAGLLYMLLSNL